VRIWVNERDTEVPSGSTVQDVRQAFKPAADVMTVNGSPVSESLTLRPGDRVVLICRGERLNREELEKLIMARSSPAVHARVKRACVGIAGAGGLGSTVAVALARLGVGRLVIADHDVVEPSNLNRQQYFVDQIGIPKVHALRDNIARMNPCVSVDARETLLTADNVAEVFRKADVLVEALDTPQAKAMLVSSFAVAFPERPVIAASGLAGVGPGSALRTRRAGRKLWLVGDEFSAAAGCGQGLMSPRVGIAAYLQAQAVLRLILGLDPAKGERDDEPNGTNQRREAADRGTALGGEASRKARRGPYGVGC